jgi:hypothetical protein
MRSKYYNLIKEKSISDILSEIDFLSYSYKKGILEFLLQKYNSDIINQALNKYKINYININRVDARKLKGYLVWLCEQVKNN